MDFACVVPDTVIQDTFSSIQIKTDSSLLFNWLYCYYHLIIQIFIIFYCHCSPLRMLASPFIIPHQPMEQSMLALSKESLAQGV